MPHFDIVHAIIPYLEPTLGKRLRTIHETALRITFVDKNIFVKNKSFLSSMMSVAGNVYSSRSPSICLLLHMEKVLYDIL